MYHGEAEKNKSHSDKSLTIIKEVKKLNGRIVSEIESEIKEIFPEEEFHKFSKEEGSKGFLLKRCEFSINEGINGYIGCTDLYTLTYRTHNEDVEKLMETLEALMRRFTIIGTDESILKVRKKKISIGDREFEFQFELNYHERLKENETEMRELEKRKREEN